MPLKKLQLQPGVNRENTRYTNENGWYESDKIRFRQGTPEKIGGWTRASENQFLGVCRSMWPWTVLTGASYIGAGTNLKYYAVIGDALGDITPIRLTTAAGDVTFAASTGSSILTVTDVAHGCVDGDFVTFSGAVSLGGDITAVVLNAEYQVTVVDNDTYTIDVGVNANALDIGNGGAAVVGAYQLNVGPEIQAPSSGWGSGTWGSGPWGVGTFTVDTIRIWNAANFGEDLIFGPKGGGLYYWDSSAGFSVRGVNLSTLVGASNTPVVHNYLLVSDTSRFVLAFGVNELGSTDIDPMLIRWSDQESAANWTPAATNQAGGIRLSTGSKIEAAAQVRQEILVWTDTAVYSLQYAGPPTVWNSQILSSNSSIVSPRAWAYAAGITYWMGNNKFYVYAGTVDTLPCAVRRYVFNDFNFTQNQQVFASTVERFNEVWWFYCSAESTTVDKYVVYNYLEKIWYYGTLARTAWIDAGVAASVPIACDYNGRFIYHESGNDDLSGDTPMPISAYITSAEFDLDDGNNFAFVWRALPDITFDGSSASAPRAYLTLLPLQNSGSGYNNPLSVAGTSEGAITRSATVPIEAYTGQVNIRVRGRQMAMKISSEDLGVAWQAGSMRLDFRPDGRKS